MTASQSRSFKTKWFAKAARKALISDAELCQAIAEVRLGQADDLGGGVFKKRLDKNRQRSIILAKGGRYWVYEYLFAKKDTANIDAQQLHDLRKIAKTYADMGNGQLTKLIISGEFMEICHDDQR
jgi:hypothetical protein